MRLHIFACNRNCADFHPIFVKNFRATATVWENSEKFKKNRKIVKNRKNRKKMKKKIVKKSKKSSKNRQKSQKLAARIIFKYLSPEFTTTVAAGN